MSRIASSMGQSGKHMESLEGRRLFASPQVVSMYADNRGEVQVTFDQPLDKTTTTPRSVFMFLPGTDGVLATADDVKIPGRVKLITGGRRVWFRPDAAVPFPAGSTYAFTIKSKTVRSAAGERIDGEWNGGGIRSGDGVPGGDVMILGKRDKGLNPTARVSTGVGNIDVRLFLDKTPANAINFLTYADDGSYDNTVVQRSLPGFIWQTGGYKVTPDNQFVGITPKTPVINEASPTNAVRGTISLARPNDGDPATDDRGTNQFFFNLADNRGTPPSGLDFQNGGFTEFGEITGAGGLAVMDQIAAFPTIDGDPQETPGIFDNLAVQNSSVTVEQASTNPQATLVLIRRIALRNKVVQWVV
jgi:cyclophilin family peptidyl-prolyl cis-trans isomerase